MQLSQIVIRVIVMALILAFRGSGFLEIVWKHLYGERGWDLRTHCRKHASAQRIVVAGPTGLHLSYGQILLLFVIPARLAPSVCRIL